MAYDMTLAKHPECFANCCMEGHHQDVARRFTTVEFVQRFDTICFHVMSMVRDDSNTHVNMPR
jgi:hypothetical protein